MFTQLKPTFVKYKHTFIESYEYNLKYKIRNPNLFQKSQTFKQKYIFLAYILNPFNCS